MAKNLKPDSYYENPSGFWAKWVGDANPEEFLSDIKGKVTCTKVLNETRKYALELEKMFNIPQISDKNREGIAQSIADYICHSENIK